MQGLEFWQMLAGVALFLLGTRFMEESLRQMTGRQFKLFLKKQTENKVKAIAGGVLITALLQSSSVVNLLVLAFVGARIISTRNALALVLGANLGSTITGWIVLMAGFSYNISDMALPVAGIAGLGFALFPQQGRGHNLSRFFFGFSFLFIGLAYMKTGMEGVVASLDFNSIREAPLVVFLLSGFVITTLIQSSAATIAIILTALYAGAISFNDGIALMLGSELGTTIKLFIAGIRGARAKRSVAMGNFIFNVVTVLIVFIFLQPLSHWVTVSLGVSDKLLALVFFQTLVNLLSILIFYPFLGRLSHFLESRNSRNEEETSFIHRSDLQLPQAALMALDNETRTFIRMVLQYAQEGFQLKDSSCHDLTVKKRFQSMSVHEKYEHLKYLYGDIHGFCIRLHQQVLIPEEAARLERLVAAIRNAMYAAKSIKDALPDMYQLEHSSNDIKFAFYGQTRATLIQFSQKACPMLVPAHLAKVEELADIYHSVTAGYAATVQEFYKENTAGGLSETEITTLLNFNREIYTAFKSFVFAMKDCLFDKKEAAYFDELPGFIR